MFDTIGKESIISYLNPCNRIMVTRNVSTCYHLPRYVRSRWSVLSLGPRQLLAQCQQYAHSNKHGDTSVKGIMFT